MKHFWFKSYGQKNKKVVILSKIDKSALTFEPETLESQSKAQKTKILA